MGCCVTMDMSMDGHMNDVGGISVLCLQSNHKTLILLDGIRINSHLTQGLYFLICAQGLSPAEMQLSLLVMEEAREALQAAPGISLIFSSLDQISSAEGSGQAGTCSASDAEVFSNGLFALMQLSDPLRIPKGPLWKKGLKAKQSRVQQKHPRQEFVFILLS
ncbi:hypothetical protein HGM15179_002647 [Zosterops borbonicus]|uniref:Uncharacterized protein n=1 Tax=Zosterops borbonicus TaxID=364589 RepID=A0A8K1LRT4_9PASS|nr:hypothetical protein HGM15179_002647 [Zosterops borbonicus]